MSLPEHGNNVAAGGRHHIWSWSTLSWCAFDMGNSAHAILVSTVGFAVYFKTYLLKGNPLGDTVWGMITALILVLSAIGSPLLSSWAYRKRKRYLAVLLTTMVCVVATALLSTGLGDNIAAALLLYIISGLGYYLALPVYNSYLRELSTGEAQTQSLSGTGWGLGYLGGMLAAAVAFALGLLSVSVTDHPEIYRQIFLIAAGFNLVLSIPMFILGFRLRTLATDSSGRWSFREIGHVFLKYKHLAIPRLLLIYWLIGEAGVVVTYYFAIVLTEYAHLEPAQIIKYSIVGQFFAIITTILAGKLAAHFGGKKVLTVVVVIWCVVPLTLSAIAFGLSFWYAVGASSLVIGAYHAIIRAKVAKCVDQFESDEERGSVWGFLEVAGRISQVLGPLLMAGATLVMPLNYAIAISAIFPVCALILLKGYRWEQ